MEDEINNLFLGRTVTGMGLFSGKQWWWDIDAEGGFIARGGNFGNTDGILWVEDNLLISNIPKITRGLKLKGAVFKNKEGSTDKLNDFLLATTWGLMPFTLEP